MTTDITDNERMNMFLNQLAEINDHMNLGQMKEQFKQFGVASEIFEDALVPFIPKILNNFQKKIRDEATVKLHPVISEALGQLEWHVLGRVEDSEEQLQLFERHFQKFAFGMIEKTKSKNVQCGAIACAARRTPRSQPGPLPTHIGRQIHRKETLLRPSLLVSQAAVKLIGEK